MCNPAVNRTLRNRNPKNPKQNPKGQAEPQGSQNPKGQVLQRHILREHPEGQGAPRGSGSTPSREHPEQGAPRGSGLAMTHFESKSHQDFK